MENSIFQKMMAFLVTFILMTSQSWAHGEDKYGPHKGFIRMPGAFHTELVLNGKNKLTQAIGRGLLDRRFFSINLLSF